MLIKKKKSTTNIRSGPETWLQTQGGEVNGLQVTGP